MREGPTRLALALGVFVLLWVAVYWSWPVRSAAISFGDAPAAIEDEPNADDVEAAAVEADDSVDEVIDEASPAFVDQSEPTFVDPLNEDRGAPGERWYVVRANDNFEVIARRELGSATAWRAIARANPFTDPERLQPGDRIRLPALSNEADESGAAGDEAIASLDVEYVVSRGDTLSGIAQSFYGTSSPTVIDAIFQHNRDVLRSPNALRLGQTLKLPPRDSLLGRDGRDGGDS
ncbi:MAG: LysM domain-containing protein [Planctomycetota bacterium]